MGSALEYPENFHDKARAATDPLTHEYILRKIYADNNRLLDQALADNPNLPLDLLEKMVKKKDKVMLRSKLVRHPKISFDQTKFLVNKVLRVPYRFMKMHTTGLEIFDYLMLNGKFIRDAYFASSILRHPEVSKKDYVDRVNLHYPTRFPSLFSDNRYDPSTIVAPYYPATKQAIEMNPNSSAELLVAVTGPIVERYFMQENAVENLNYPIELSAAYHIEMLDYYKWRPSYVIALENVVNVWLKRVVGDGPWEDLPLAWKLKMIAG